MDKDKNTNNINKDLNIDLLSIEEVAKRFMVSKTTIHRWIKEDGFPSIKLRGTLRFDAREVREWVNQNRRVNKAGD